MQKFVYITISKIDKLTDKTSYINIIYFVFDKIMKMNISNEKVVKSCE